MNNWRLEFSKSALKQLTKLQPALSARILDRLQNMVLSSDPRRSGKALTGKYAGHCRYRVGDYRIVCRILDDRMLVFVVAVADRRDIYR